MNEEGDHEKWRDPLVPDLLVELAGKDGADAKPYHRPYQEKQVREFLEQIAGAKRQHSRQG